MIDVRYTQKKEGAMTEHSNRYDIPRRNHQAFLLQEPIQETEKVPGDYWYDHMLDILTATTRRREVCYV
jgi:hypothetical protein